MRRLTLLVAVLVAVLLGVGFVGASSSAGSVRWVITRLEAGNGWVATDVVAINSRGQIIGNGCPPVAGCGESHAFLWQRGKMTDLGTLGEGDSRALGLNEGGVIVGSSSAKALFAATLLQRAVRWQNGRIGELDTPVGSQSQALAINDRGQIVGWSETKAGVRHACRWQDGRVIDLGTLGGAQSEAVAINGSGEVVGWSDTKAGIRHAFLWRANRMRDVGAFGGKWSEATAVNGHGQIVGVWGSADTPRGFSWKKGRVADLGRLAPPGQIAINNSGQVVGERAWIGRAFLWANGRMTNLALPRGADASGASAINGRGQIVGWCNFGGEERGCFWQGRTVTDLGIIKDPGQEATGHASAISESGKIVGHISYRMDFGQAVLWTRKTGN